MLEVHSLSKSFGYFQVWNDVSFTLEKGSICGLFGVNGSGKTTLLKCIAGIVSPNSGQILIDGDSLKKDANKRKHIGFLSHQSMYYHDLTCIENLQFTASLYKLTFTRSELINRLDNVGLKKWADTAAKTFSRGMQQRLALCKSLLHDPNLILFDEPYTGLDEEASDDLSNTITELKQQGKTILLVTHDIKQGYELADKVALLSDQKLSVFLPKSDISFENFHQGFLNKGNSV